MSTQITYFVHSTTADNQNGISSGWNDLPLSAIGIEQSYELREALQGRTFDVIISSDFLRARQTVEIVFPDHPHVIYDARLRECNYGDMNGQPASIVEPLQESISTPFPDGESYEDVLHRVRELIEEVRREYPGKSVAFVSSKAPQLCLDVILKGNTWEEAFANDWRKTKNWQAGWEYQIDEDAGK